MATRAPPSHCRPAGSRSRASALGSLVTGLLVTGLLMPPLAAAEPTAEDVTRAVVAVQARVPPGSRTTETLGKEREGNGVVIDADGLVLTIGYLILEADEVTVGDGDGRPTPADVVAYDHRTGFGLLRARKPLGITPLRLGVSGELEAGENALVVSQGGPRRALAVKLMSRRDFAGYWEYLLEGALFTAPPHPHYGGAALLNGAGELIGIGSLLVNDAYPAAVPVPGNMFVPIDALKPILAELLAQGHRSAPPNPWLGIYTLEQSGRVFVARVAADGPAEAAGIKPGDLIIGVAGRRIASIADLYRKVWASGPAGTEVRLDIIAHDAQTPEIKQITVKSRERLDWLKSRRL